MVASELIRVSFGIIEAISAGDVLVIDDKVMFDENVTELFRVNAG